MTENQVKERPILFSGAMVRALLAGTKTQTRRATGLDFINENPGCWQRQWVPAKDGKHWLFTCGDDRVQVKCPYGVEGDRLWVRETLFWSGCDDDWCYQADNVQLWTGRGDEAYTANILLNEGKAIPSIHMPREASRLLLEIVSVRVERLQDISEADAVAEGTTPITNSPNCLDRYRVGYEHLWGSINGPESWAANPWVFVIEFKVIKP